MKANKIKMVAGILAASAVATTFPSIKASAGDPTKAAEIIYEGFIKNNLTSVTVKDTDIPLGETLKELEHLDSPDNIYDGEFLVHYGAWHKVGHTTFTEFYNDRRYSSIEEIDNLADTMVATIRRRAGENASN